MKLACSLILAVGLAGGYATDTQAQRSAKTSSREIVGTIDSISGSRLLIRTRTGARVRVDALAAMAGGHSAVLFVGRSVDVVGTVDNAGVLHAATIWRVKDSPALWPPDR